MLLYENNINLIIITLKILYFKEERPHDQGGDFAVSNLYLPNANIPKPIRQIKNAC